MYFYVSVVKLLLLISVATLSEGVTPEECGFNVTSGSFQDGNNNTNISGSESGSGSGDENFNFTSCDEISSIFANARRTAAPRIIATVYPIASTPVYFVESTILSSMMPYPTSSAFQSRSFKTTDLSDISSKMMSTVMSDRPLFPTSSASPPPSSSSIIRLTSSSSMIEPTPTPTPIPTPTSTESPPSTLLPTKVTPSVPSLLDESIVQITLDNITMNKWNTGKDEVQKIIADAATTFCTKSPTKCGLDPMSSSFVIEPSDVRFVDEPDDNRPIISVAIVLPDGSIPAKELVDLLSQNETKQKIQKAASAKIIGIVKKPVPTPDPTEGIKESSPFPVGAVVGGVVGGLLVICLVVLAVYLWKHKKGSFQVAPAKQVEEGKDVERFAPKAPTATQERQTESMACPPSKAASAGAVPATEYAFHNPRTNVDPLRSPSPLEDIPMTEFSSEVAQRAEEEPGTVPKAHKGRASNPDIWPEARKAGRMASKSSLPPIGTSQAE